MRNYIMIGLIWCFCTSLIWGADVKLTSDPAQQKIDKQVKQLITEKQDFKAALMVYAKAARANPSSVYYKNQFALLRRIIKMNRALTVETNPKKWTSYAKAVRSYYYTQGYYTQALELDMQAFKKFPEPSFAVNKLESLLLLNKNQQAAELLTHNSLKANTDMRLSTLRLVCLSRTNQTDKALASAESIKIDPRKYPETLLDLARVYKAANKDKLAMACLKQFLEHTVPTALPGMRRMAENCTEFNTLLNTKSFQAVLATQSKVSQSGCTGGSSCASCKLKSKCASSKN